VLGTSGQESERVAQFQERMRQCLAAQTDFTDMMPRIEGLISQLGSERPQDKMHALATAGRVDLRYIKAWTHLRNRQVHPKLTDLKKPDAIDMQKLLDLVHQAEMLLRQLTFHLIGYVGPFTDYGIAGFPSKQYPLPSSPSAPVDDGV
jgi:hypothetical protein